MVHSMENNWATGCRLDQNEYLAWKLLDYIQFPNLHAYVAMYFGQLELWLLINQKYSFHESLYEWHLFYNLDQYLHLEQND